MLYFVLAMLTGLVVLVEGIGAAAVLIVLAAPFILAANAYYNWRQDNPRKPARKNKHGLPWYWTI